MKKIIQKVHLSIIGKQPCSNFGVQEWIDEEISKLPVNHEIIEVYIQITVSPCTHVVTMNLYLKSSTKDGNEELKKRTKTWEINYEDAEKFYRMMEKIS